MYRNCAQESKENAIRLLTIGGENSLGLRTQFCGEVSVLVDHDVSDKAAGR